MNWTTAKLLFAEGRLSIRAIGRRCTIPENTLRRNAKAEGWKRGRRPDFEEFGESVENSDFTENGKLAESGKGIPTDPAAIADRGRDLVGRMLAELEAITSLKGELRDIIINVTKDDGDGRRRTWLLRSIGLASRVRVLKDLAAAARTLGDGAALAAGGKKQEAKGKAARVAATGRFATPPVPPKLVIDNERVDVDDVQ
jgi:hypothetical protein